MHPMSANRAMTSKSPVEHSIGAAFEHIHRHTMGQFGLTRRPRRRSILLAEPHTPRAAGKGLPAQPSRPPVAPAA